jgi:hypothetical protein
MSDTYRPLAAGSGRPEAPHVTEPRQLTPAELSGVTGGKGDDDYFQVHNGPGYTYGAYHYQRHFYTVAPWGRF